MTNTLNLAVCINPTANLSCGPSLEASLPALPLAVKALTQTGLSRVLLCPEDQILPGTGGFCNGAKALVGCQEAEWSKTPEAAYGQSVLLEQRLANEYQKCLIFQCLLTSNTCALLQVDWEW